MPAQVILRKYTGKDGSFGTLVSSLGIKRVDTCVPAVWSSERLGGKVVPADDASEASFYCIYGEEDKNCTAYSMECVFKIHLEKAPDVQLSNIRIYPDEKDRPPEDGRAHPVLRIGNSVSYSKPTNAKSNIAVRDIWDFSKDHPFYLTVAGLYGQYSDPGLGQTQFNVEYKDYGYGNVICLNGTRQLAVTVPTRTSDEKEIILTFVNRSFNDSENFIEFLDPKTGKGIDKSYVTVDRTTEGYVCSLKVRTKGPDTKDLWDLYPNGIVYSIPKFDGIDHPNSGYLIVWVNAWNNPSGFDQNAYVPGRWFVQSRDPKTYKITEKTIEPPYEDRPIEYYDVEVKIGPDGKPAYYVNDMRKPQLLFDLRNVYRIFNKSGDKYPLRLVSNFRSPMASDPNDVVTDGVPVIRGGTKNEELIIDPEAMLKAGACLGGYQCVCAPDFGNVVYQHNLCLCGQYNLCRVGGGIYNPLMAGETDYVYLQLEVPGTAEPGYAVPQLHIEYDEN